MTAYLEVALKASLEAGKAIMEIYKKSEVEVILKKDNSPLTMADQKANEIINKILLPLKIPIISEENQEINFVERENWKRCWIVDPLDGTKEFIRRNDEFTVNIALVEEGKPVIGVIYAPALKILYFGAVPSSKAYKYHVSYDDILPEEILQTAREISPSNSESDCLKVVGSRSHMNEETSQYINELKSKYGKQIEIVPKGSSLKFCLLAEGNAHIYPRFGPTMEWDTAAGHAICEAVGVKCTWRDNGKPITYNRENLVNGHFSVSYEG